MLRQARILGVLCAPAVACAALAFLPAAAMADTTITGSPSVTGVTQVGQTLTCDTTALTLNDPGTDGIPDYTDYTWYQDSTSGTQVADGLSDTTYTPVAADVGHPLVCKVTANDGTGSDATASSVASPAVAPIPSIMITQFSPSVSGNIGEHVSGVTVNLTLKRKTDNGTLTTVATGSAQASPTTGTWSTMLTQVAGSQADALGAPADELDVSYSGTGVALPPNGAYSEGSGGVHFIGGDSTISADGHTVGLPAVAPCSHESVIVDAGAPTSTGFNAGPGDCELTGQSLTDSNHVQASDAAPVTAADMSVSNVTSVSDIGLPGVGNGEANGAGIPACSADLVSGFVFCGSLKPGSFTVNSTPLAISQNPGGGGGYSVYSGSAFVPGLASGGTATLKEGTTTISMLHLGTLQVQIDSSSNLAGSCQPTKALGVTTGGSQSLCPAGGQIPPFVYSGDSVPDEFDDLSGGTTILNVPNVSNPIPTSGDSIPGGFTAYADIFGTGTTSQVLSQVASLNLEITPHGAGSPAFSQDTTMASDNSGPFADVAVPALSPGRYYANWTLIDSHGDVNAWAAGFNSNALFAVSSATTGPQGPQGPTGATGAPGAAGPRGPQGPAGQSSKCTVKTTGTGVHKKQHIHCVLVSSSVRFVSIEITRGKRTYAVGTAVVHGRRTSVAMRGLHAIKRGRYLVTVLEMRGTKAVVVRYQTTL